MARDHARIYLSIWDDDDFRALSPLAQHLYFVLMTSPEMNYAGVTDWRPNRIAKRAAAWTTYGVEIAAQELSEHLYILIDTDTEEVLLRSLIRHDGLLEQPNLAVAVRKAWAALASPNLRGAVVHELNRLRKDKPDLKGWPKVEEVLDKPAMNPSDHPSFHPSEKGSDDPSRKGSVDPSVGHGANPSDDPSEKGSPITAPSSQLPTPAPNSTDGSTTERGKRSETHRARDATEPPPGDTPSAAASGEPRCTRHPFGTDEPCVACAKVSEYRDRLERKRREELIEASRNCPDCEGTGKVLDPDTKMPTAKRCTHPKSRRSA